MKTENQILTKRTLKHKLAALYFCQMKKLKCPAIYLNRSGKAGTKKWRLTENFKYLIVDSLTS